jgi:hypothetical protein
VHPENPRYLADASGKPLYLAGSHVWYVIQGPDTAHATTFLDYIKALGHTFTRVWCFLYYNQITYDDLTNYPAQPWPYLRTGPGTALDGAPKFDLTRPNDTYFQSLKDFVHAAQNRGIICSIMLFGSYNLIRNAEFNNCVWHGSNNINPETLVLSKGPDFFAMNPGVLRLQEAHVRRVVDALNDYDNVMWEIMNESMDAPNVITWHDHMIRYLRAYEATKPKQHLIGMTGGPATAGGQKMFQSVADWVSPDAGSSDGDYKNFGGSGHTRKIVLNDTDHLRGVIYDKTVVRPWIWKTFTRGNHPLFMEDRRLFTRAPTAGEEGIRRALGHTVSYANRMNLAKAVPRADLASTGYALAQPGVEYLVYQPRSGAFTVNLAAGTYFYEWFNPDAGTVDSSGSLSAAEGQRIFNPPFAGDAVLYLKTIPSASSRE